MTYLTFGEYELAVDTTLSATVRTYFTNTLEPRAVGFIENQVGYTFVSGAAVEKKFNPLERCTTSRLFFHTWTAAAPTVLTLGGVDIKSECVWLPSEGPPYWGADLKKGSSFFDFGSEPLEALAITAAWGYSTAAPDRIKEAVILFCQMGLKNRKGEQHDWLKKDFWRILEEYPKFQVVAG